MRRKPPKRVYAVISDDVYGPVFCLSKRSAKAECRDQRAATLDAVIVVYVPERGGGDHGDV